MRASHLNPNESYFIFTSCAFRVGMHRDVTKGLVLEGTKIGGREGLTFTFNFQGHLVDYSLLALRLSQSNSATLI